MFSKFTKIFVRKLLREKIYDSIDLYITHVNGMLANL